MNIEKMKSIIANKFKAEGCSFTENDIVIIEGEKNVHFQIHIKDYEHIIFNMFLLKPDEFFNDNYIVKITSEDMKQFNESIYIETLTDFNIESALIELGYYIASRF